MRVERLQKNTGVILLLYIFTSALLFPCLSAASDRDVDPYLIYVDPVTGKYTTQKPGHEATPPVQPVKPAVSENPGPARQTQPDRSGFVAALILGPGIVVFSHLLALGIIKIRTP